MKKVIIWICCLLIVIPPFTYVSIQPVEAASDDIQTLSVDVISSSVDANPYVSYWELDNGSFRAANNYTGDKTVLSSGGFPVENEMAQRLSMDDYPASYYYVSTNQSLRYAQAAVSQRQVNGITIGNNTTQAYSEPPSNTNIIAYSITGGNRSPRTCEPYNSTGKLECKYPYTFVLQYKGKVEITKRITAKSDSTIGVGDTVNVTASIATKEGANASFGSETDVSYRTGETVWKTDKQAVATVDSSGKVTGVSTGTANICATWTKEEQPFGKWDIVDCVTITVTDGTGITVTGTPDNACIITGQTKKVKLSAKLTKVDGSTYDLSAGHTKLTFTSSNTSVATVLSNGELTLKGIGKTTITIKFVDTAQNINESTTVEINVADCDNPIDPPPGGGTTIGGSCERVFQSTGIGGIQNASFTFPNPSGSLSSDSGQFNVVQGIPSSEYLRADARSEEYLFEQNFQQQTGNVVFNNIKVTKTFTLKWKEEQPADKDGKKPPPKEMSEQEIKDITVSGITRPYTYWEVTTYNVLQLSNARITNYALPNGEVTLPSNISVSANARHIDAVESHVFPAECVEITLPAETIDGGSSKPSAPDFSGEGKAEAESKIGENKVENDSASFKSSTIMNNTRTSVNGPTPSSIPLPSMIEMSKRNLQIDTIKTNYWQSPSTGTMNYVPVFSLTNSASNQSFNFGVNNVTVHTPITMYSRATDDKEHDQRIDPPKRSTPPNPNIDRHAFILDRPFTVSLPTTGQHRNIPGYGNNNYAKYTKSKQVRFPFDVYSETKQAFYPANTWIEVPVNMENVTFFLPVWVPEKQYTVDFRAFAINATTSGDFGGNEKEANITIPNPSWNVPPAGTQSAAHIVTDSIMVDVVGRLYDLQVTDIDDYNWKNVFRTTDGITPSGKSYFVGLKGIDKAVRGNVKPYVLPISHASHPSGIKNLAVKQGYNFKFNFKTKGDMENMNDAIRIVPSFYFVNKDGKNRREVDLYYHENDKKFIKIASADDIVYREVSLNQTDRNVNINELTNNALHYHDFAERFNLVDLKANHTRTSFARNYNKHYSKEFVQTGPYGWQILNWRLRTYRGPLESLVPPTSMVPPKEVVTKEQTWYGEYSIPANTYVVPKDAKVNEAGRINGLNENHPLFLKDGYIIVNFDIETINNGDLNKPYLSYHNAFYMSQWTDMEEFQSSFVDGYGNAFTTVEGDVLYYHADQSALDDFSASVTH